MFDEELSRSPSEDTLEAMHKAARPAFAALGRGSSPRNQLFRPCRLGLIGLAVAVFLWGFGYKLSLYHKTQSSGPVVKMWVEQRNTSTVLDSSFNARFGRIPTLQALSVVVQLQLPVRSSISRITPIVRRNVSYLDFLIPFRSPPAQRFLLT